MRSTRFIALLVVLILLGLAGRAKGNDGDLLTLGRDNVASTTTTCCGQGGAAFSIQNLSYGHMGSPSAGRLVIKAGTISRAISTASDSRGSLAIATVQAPTATGVWVASAHVTAVGRLVIVLNTPAPTDTTVAYMMFN